jgi:adenylate cyclase
MTAAQINRRLAAILAADVVGYSRIMAQDEAGTLASLKLHRETVFDPAVAEHGGRIFKVMGDGILVEFASAVDAVNCAVAIQTSAPPEPPSGHDIKLRIGINLGDIIVEDGDIFGNGVNIAARLEPLADPGGICVSAIVDESVGNRVSVSFEDCGEVQVKNLDRPIRVLKWRTGYAGAEGSSHQQNSTVPEKTTSSLAVLPFDNMSGNPEDEYFSDGITEDIITDLSKLPKLLIIARNSSFAYKGKNVDVRKVGRELGVRTVLEGSVRRAGSRVRINAQLIDAENGAHLWAERYDREITDIFALQDDITGRIVAALKIAFNPKEEQRPAGSSQQNIEAYEYMLRARAMFFSGVTSPQLFEQVSLLLNKAIECDPGSAEAYALLAILQAIDLQNRFTEHHGDAPAAAMRFAEQAIANDANEPIAHYAAAVASIACGKLDRAMAENEAALALNPNYALALESQAVVHMLSGNQMKAISNLERALRLDPASAQQFIHFLGMAYLIAGKFATAAAYFRERIVLVPRSDFSRAFLVSALGHIGEIEEARKVWRELLDINPEYSFQRHISRWPFKKKEDADRIREGIAKAGLE